MCPAVKVESDAENILLSWRRRLFYAIFTTFLILVTIPFLLSLHTSLNEGNWFLLTLHSFGFLCSLALVFVRKIPFGVAAPTGLICMLVVGIAALAHFGPFGSGKIWLFSFSILATLLYGLPVGLFTVGLNTLAISVIGSLMRNLVFGWTDNPGMSMQMWIITGVTFIFLNGIVVVSLAVLVDALEKRLIRENQLRKDISRTSSELAESEEKLSQAIQGSVIPTFVIDREHIITHWNDACEKVTGKSPSEMIGTNNQWVAFGTVKRAVPADVVLQKAAGELPDREILKLLRQSPLVEGGLEGDIRVETPSGEEKLLLCTAALLRNRAGTAVGAIQTFMDMTERKQVEAQLQQSRKMDAIGRLAGGVAHDFNNMLGVIIGHVDMIIEGIEEDSMLNNGLHEIKSAAVRSADLTKQLLAFARKQSVEPVLLNLNLALQDMSQMLDRLIGEEIELLWTYEENLWPVKIDRSQIDQILANLCVNGRDAIDGIGEIAIETSNAKLDSIYCDSVPHTLPGDYVLLSVTDNGKGIDKETREMIFEPFFTTKERGRGTGLGLSTIHGIVKQNGGHISVYSESGYGTTFRIYIPRFHGEFPSPVQREISATHCPDHGNVLLVEDEESIRRITSNMLVKLGYKVTEASTPEEAVKIASNPTMIFDLLLTDVVMPGMNGKDLADFLLERKPNLKVLFMSGYTADVIASRGVLEEGMHFLGKPFSCEELALKVRETLII